ncbi:hypothetical protein CASFOL_004855 [Castilleja foliolosa]|uniref:SWIM-type domain-containing protein n=1 Tax=Castilleja foliolosa TaxID=1961234 RepID=A0ABD3EBN7_9LAMI
MEIEDKADNDNGGEEDSFRNSNDGEGDINHIIDISGSLMGLKRKNIQDFYELYCEHAREVGFGVRKTTSRSNDAGVIIEKYFVCSCEGTKRPSTSSHSVEKKEKKGNITRTGCKASLRVKMNSDGDYEVVSHNTLHNHTFWKDSSRAHHSERLITADDVIYSGAIPINSVQDVEGEHFACLSRLKTSALEGGDAQALVDTLCQQSTEDRDFFFRVKFDDAGKLSNVFWRDSMMKEDYRIYGDAVVFDTSYRAKYNLICAQFIGVNNHWKNVMFGCAFILDEKTESFEWVLDVFKKSMEDQSPVTLFTDHEIAIENAVEKVFPGKKHRLCRWNLYQDAVARFGKLKGDKCFSDTFNKCLTGCTTETEFESDWNTLISKTGLEDHSWFKRLYNSREKWCTGDFFSTGVSSSQRTERANIAIRFNAKQTTGLNEFYASFKETIKRWRSNEVKDEFKCSKATPTSVLQLRGILKHASEVYTLTIFRDFEEEFLNSISTSCKMLHSDNDITFYSVTHDDGVTSHDVTFSVVDTKISCSCKRFEECGLLCRHCLRVFHMHSVSRIPDCYVKSRWTKYAKRILWEKKSDREIDTSDDCVPWRHDVMRRYYNLILLAEENKETRRIIEDGYKRDSASVDSVMGVSSSTVVLDSERSIKQRTK